jgi:hypothetical protein
MATTAPFPAPPYRTPIRTASTAIDDPQAAVQALFRALDPQSLAGVLLFCSSRYPLAALADAINACSEGLTVVGCTSSGEIAPSGVVEGTITAIGFPGDSFTLNAVRFDGLDHFEPSVGQAVIRSLVADATAASQGLGDHLSRAAIFLVDGLSHREELLAMTVQNALGDIPLIGGSSGDGLAFKQTFIFEGGAFRRDAALVAILSTSRPMQMFRAQHYAPGTIKMVVTAADPVGRVVTEINAEPAAAEYARLIGVPIDALGPELFASHPPMVRAGGEYYARSVQSANPDGSLTFYCAVDAGVVMTLGEERDIMAGLGTLFDGLETAVAGVDRIIGFDCVLNAVGVSQRQLSHAVSALFAQKRVVGFNTYGEQYHALHVNQTFSGLAIGR